MGLLEQHLCRWKGAVRVSLPGRATFLAMLAVGAMTLGGSAVAAGTANATPSNPSVVVQGKVYVCNSGDRIMSIYRRTSNGARLGRYIGGGTYELDLANVPTRGEMVTGLVTCRNTSSPRKFYARPFEPFIVSRPMNGVTFHHNFVRG